jgi:sugar phosphate isomerase/epimerase
MKSSHELSRRCFIKGAAGLILSTKALAIMRNRSFSSQSKPWVIACRDTLLKATKKPDCWSAMKELGVSGVEVEVNLDLICPVLYHTRKKYSLNSSSNIQALKDELLKNKFDITAFLVHNRLDERLQQEIAWARKLVTAAQELDVNVIRIDVVPRRTRREEFLPFAIKACTKLCEIVEGTQIRYGIENHGSVTNDPEFLQQLFDGVDSRHLGLTLDTANFYWYGHPLNELYKIFERFTPRIFHTHCKSIRYPDDKKNVRRPRGWEYSRYACPIYEGDIDFRKFAAILRRANYRGDLCLENESLRKYPESQRTEVLKKEITFLQSLSRLNEAFSGSPAHLREF